MLWLLLGIGVYLGASASSALVAVPDLSGVTRFTRATALPSPVGAVESDDLAGLDDPADADGEMLFGPAHTDPRLHAPSCPYPVRSAGTHPCRHRPSSSRSSDDSPG